MNPHSLPAGHRRGLTEREAAACAMIVHDDYPDAETRLVDRCGIRRWGVWIPRLYSDDPMGPRDAGFLVFSPADIARALASRAAG